MNMKKTKLSDIILPSKKINYFVVTILLFGVISGSIFLVILDSGDKSGTVTKLSPKMVYRSSCGKCNK